MTRKANKPAIPSIFEMGMRACVLEQTYDRLDKIFISSDVGDFAAGSQNRTARELAYDRQEALVALALTYPARTLEDVAVQLSMAWILVDRMTAVELEEFARDEAAKKLDRLLASALPIVCAAAGLQLEQLGGADLAERCAKQFPAEVPL
jgi:hypothetical protein